MDKALNQLIGTIYQIAAQKDKKEHGELMLQQNRAVKLFKARIKNLLVSSVVGQSEQFKCLNVACDEMINRSSGKYFCKKHRRKLGI